jgi:alpha-2-macroglobulin
MRVSATALLIVSLFTATVTGADPAPELVSRAEKLTREQPSVQRRIGLSEVYRAAGRPADALQALLGTEARVQSEQEQLAELTCWRMLPLPPSGRDAFARQVARLRDVAPENPWGGVHAMLLALHDGDRAALLGASDGPPKPERFPGVIAESPHHTLLQGLGLSYERAGLEVIASRSHEALHALRDLDRGLGREAAFLRGNGEVDGAAKLERARDELRRAYDAAARCVVEKLFALTLLGRTQQRDALWQRAKAHPYLTDPKALGELLNRTEALVSRPLLVDPLLRSEIQFLDSPPAPHDFRPSTTVLLRLASRRKTEQTGATIYEGDVALTLGSIEVTCRRLVVVRPPEGGLTLTGTGSVVVRGVPGLQSVEADRLTLNSDTLACTFGGDVRLRRRDGVTKLRACTITRTGEVRDARSLLDDFAAALDVAQQLELLPSIMRTYDDDELPDEVRFRLALALLHPHLSWHAPFLPAPAEREPRDREKKRERQGDGGEAGPWREASGGEKWMLGGGLPKLEDDLRRAVEDFNRRRTGDEERVELPPVTVFPWRLRDAEHPDIARALKLLDGVGGELRPKARAWADDVRRNNTVLTFDVAGGYAANRPAAVVMDVRNADRVEFRLYRVRKPENLLAVLARVGTDFVYRDHGLQHGEQLQRLIKQIAELKRAAARIEMGQGNERARPKPTLDQADLVEQWVVDPSRLKTLPESGAVHFEREDWELSRRDDGDYFDDECSAHAARLEKRYRPDRFAVSSWQCDRILEVPAKAVAEAGAYILVAEANNQGTYVPLVVDPLSLTLRRCRDGVLALVSDADGKGPIPGARVVADGQRGEAVTDAAGVAFARVFAAGDRAIVAHKDGRFAVGGFGRVFEGIYRNPWDRLHRERAWLGLEAFADEKQSEAQVYADQHVVAAYTDRPTYRPGQQVQFKLIVRRLRPDAKPGEAAPPGFRAEEFDRATRLELPAEGMELGYVVVDPGGREVGSGRMRLNDYGTAAGTVALPAEAATGDYSLRVRLADLERIVPEVFAVRYYRRPNFEVVASGVPAKAKGAEKLTVRLEGRYYFGKPVAGGRVGVRLVGAEGGRPLAEVDGQLDANGKTAVELELPARLHGGKYQIVGTLTDDSDRTATKSLPLEVEGTTPRGGLAKVPRFVAVDRDVAVSTEAELVALAKDGVRRTFKSEKGTATLRLPLPGWYRLTAAGEEAVVFAHGGDGVPDLAPPVDWGEWPGWVDLSLYHSEEEGMPPDVLRREASVLALFDRQFAEVGGRVRLLIQVPFRKARVLFTVEGYTVLDYLVADVKAGPYAVVELPVTRRHLPNFYLQALAISGGDRVAVAEEVAERLARERKRGDRRDTGEDPRWCRIDVTDPQRPAGEERLKVQVDPERTEYRPGEEVAVRVRVTDLRGTPRAAEMSLAAVDDSVFSFGEDNLPSLAAALGDPHPPQRFRRKAWRSSLGNRWQPMAEARMQEVKRVQEAQAMRSDRAVRELEERALERVPLASLPGVMPISTLPFGRLRTDFRETAAWLPQLRTGDDGTLRTTFKLPDSLTRYRLSAVALTRQSELGVGRSRVAASLPLSVQVFLPRFAVEKDRLLAVGLVHNNDKEDRECNLAWEVRGAKVHGLADGFAARIDGWSAEDAGGKTVGRGRVTVPAGRAVRVGLWLAFDRPGTVGVVFRCGAGNDADSEERTLTVHPLGRPRTVVLEGDFKGSRKVQLPEGFVASDLQVVLARGELAQSLEGVGGLVEYPYGCVEQTMSRFLPAVAVKDATRHAPIGLPPDVAARLPDVLAKGLARLVAFQHNDGGWGWWEHDATDDRMTTYVVYGLARCRIAGVPVSQGVLERGGAYLRERLREGKVPETHVASAWLALALAGSVDTAELRKAADRAREGREESRAMMALACQAAGLREEGERLWKTVHNWEPQSTEWMALNLNLKLAFGAPLDAVLQTAGRLLAARRGLGWENTQATAWAVMALSRVSVYAAERPGAKRVRVTVAGRDVLDVKDAAELTKLVQRVRISGGKVPEAAVVEMAVESDEAVRYSVIATGTQRQDVLEPEGREVRVRRQLETLDGKPFVGRLKVGDVVAVRLTVDLDQRREYLLLEERRPAGCEFADERLESAPAMRPAHVEFRDDRLCAFFGALPAGRHEFVYHLRAESAGTSHVLPGCVYPMYADHLRGETGSLRLEILPREE